MKFWLHFAPWNFVVKKLYYSQHLPVFRYKCFYCIYGTLIWFLYKMRRTASGHSNASQRSNCTFKSKCFTWNFIKYRKFGRLWFHNQIYFQLLLVRGKCWYKKFIIIVGAINEKYNNKIFQGHSLMDCQLLKNRMFHVKHSVAQRTKIKQTLFVFEFAQNIANPVQIVFIVVIDIYAPLAIVP